MMYRRIANGLIGLCFVAGGIFGFYWLTQQDPKQTHQIIGALDGFVLFCILAVMFGTGMSMLVNSFVSDDALRHEIERRRFESWVKEKTPITNLNRMPNGAYDCWEVELAWRAWEASKTYFE